jgi:hypothetical protein
MYKSKYFSEEEFLHCSPSCRMEDMDADFLKKLDAVREEAGIPMILTSAYRSREHELKKGRSGNGAHTHRVGVDIRCLTSSNRYKIVNAALACGIHRIGIGKTFIHLDDDPSLPKDVIWDYYSNN